jgi:pSer/pThr/pTyr-binding forkhead associated (FHA) protein
MSQYVLVFTHPKLGEQRLTLAAHQSYRLGAHSDNDVVVPQKDVSRHHAVLTTFDGRFQITDLSSKNGTFVNGQRTASGDVRCGDQLGLSSATLQILEVRDEDPEDARVVTWAPSSGMPADAGAEDTAQVSLVASAEDIVDLLEITLAGAARGAVTEPLRWAVKRLGLEAALVLYGDGRGSVSMVASAGDLGPLVLSHTTVSRLCAEMLDETPVGSPRLRQLEVQGEQLLFGRVGVQHLLVVRHAGHPPAVTDLRALIASTSAILGSAALAQEASAAAGLRGAGAVDTGAAGDGGGWSADAAALRALLDQPLIEARAAFERLRVERALAATDGNWTAAAAILGMSRAGLYKLARRLGVSA